MSNLMEFTWSIQQKTHQLFKKITEHPNILTSNEYGEAVVYGDAIPGSNFNRYSNQW